MPPNKNLVLKYKKPIVAIDGQSIFINDSGPVNIAFFQFREEKNDDIRADVVAAVRLHSIDELRNLQRQINDTIKRHTNRER